MRSKGGEGHRKEGLAGRGGGGRRRRRQVVAGLTLYISAVESSNRACKRREFRPDWQAGGPAAASTMLWCVAEGSGRAMARGTSFSQLGRDRGQWRRCELSGQLRQGSLPVHLLPGRCWPAARQNRHAQVCLLRQTSMPTKLQRAWPPLARSGVGRFERRLQACPQYADQSQAVFLEICEGWHSMPDIAASLPPPPPAACRFTNLRWNKCGGATPLAAARRPAGMLLRPAGMLLQVLLQPLREAQPGTQGCGRAPPFCCARAFHTGAAGLP